MREPRSAPARAAAVLEILLGLGGLTLLGWMIHRIGLSLLWSNLSHFGLMPTLFLAAVYSLAQVFFCLAWLWVVDPFGAVGFGRLFAAYLAGDALNMTVPSGNLAGEPVKVMLLGGALPMESAVTSVTVYKFADFVSMTLFLLMGWAAHFFFYSLPVSWNVGAGIVVGGMGAVSAFLFMVQKRGFFHPAGKWLGKAAIFEAWIEKKLDSAHSVDRGIRDFYAHHPRRFALSVLFNLIAWFGGVLEIALFMKLAGLQTSLAAAMTIETFSLFINNVAFFVPARLGVGEGGRVLLFLTLGYTPQAGLSYGIIRRIRESAWVGIGFLILLFMRKRRGPHKNPSDLS